MWTKSITRSHELKMKHVIKLCTNDELLASWNLYMENLFNRLHLRLNLCNPLVKPFHSWWHHHLLRVDSLNIVLEDGKVVVRQLNKVFNFSLNFLLFHFKLFPLIQLILARFKPTLTLGTLLPNTSIDR